jgi:hypothetical protein
LDEITKEKQRIGEALAHVDAQREKLTGQLSELEAAERVLAPSWLGRLFCWTGLHGVPGRPARPRPLAVAA